MCNIVHGSRDESMLERFGQVATAGSRPQGKKTHIFRAERGSFDTITTIQFFKEGVFSGITYPSGGLPPIMDTRGMGGSRNGLNPALSTYSKPEFFATSMRVFIGRRRGGETYRDSTPEFQRLRSLLLEGPNSQTTMRPPGAKTRRISENRSRRSGSSKCLMT